jgi:hypothetical protein
MSSKLFYYYALYKHFCFHPSFLFGVKYTGCIWNTCVNFNQSKNSNLWNFSLITFCKIRKSIPTFFAPQFYQTSRFVWLTTSLYFFWNHENFHFNYLIFSITGSFLSQQKNFALTHWRVYTLMANLFQILNQFVMIFCKNVIEKSFINWWVLSLGKINTRISDTPCIVNSKNSWSVKIKF